MPTSMMLMGSDHNNTNLTLSEDHEVVHQDSHLQTATTRRQYSNGGRRKSSSRGNSDQSKKKQPQRGMGVAQLERLRLEERWKKITEINQISSSPPPPPISSSSSLPNYAVVPVHLTKKFGGFPLNLNHHHHQPQPPAAMLFQGNLYGADHVRSITETSKELSSTPNVIIKSFSSDHCSVCNRKKRIVSGENLVFNGSVKDMNEEMPSIITSSDFVGFNIGQNYSGKNQDFGKKATFHARTTYSVGNDIDQGVEVVAVHRKGASSSSSSGDGSGDVLMEYEFFPSGKGSSEPSSSVNAAVMYGGDASCATTTTGHGCVAVDASNSIDLSLRLSY
ncbi:hypothetical protein ACH5RR_028003 [Cinchona calisaya]|uniref:Uncharacterized protein n=1 Tax=Cinchona calisaya TaxID=153742 RepID=A0ABD2YMI9_9GENT